MSKDEFKNTIEYKQRIRDFRLMMALAIAIVAIFFTMGLIFFFCFLDLSKRIAFIVLICIDTLGLFDAIGPIGYLIWIRKKLSSIYKNLNDMYIFDYELSLPINHKFVISFEYEGEKHEIASYCFRDSYDLKDKFVTVGYIEGLDVVLLLNEKKYDYSE